MQDLARSERAAVRERDALRQAQRNTQLLEGAMRVNRVRKTGEGGPAGFPVAPLLTGTAPLAMPLPASAPPPRAEQLVTLQQRVDEMQRREDAASAAQIELANLRGERTHWPVRLTPIHAQRWREQWSAPYGHLLIVFSLLYPSSSVRLGPPSSRRDAIMKLLAVGSATAAVQALTDLQSEKVPFLTSSFPSPHAAPPLPFAPWAYHYREEAECAPCRFPARHTFCPLTAHHSAQAHLASECATRASELEKAAAARADTEAKVRV